MVCVAVLLGAWGIGLGIRHVRFRNAAIESQAATEPQLSANIQKPNGVAEPKGEPAEMAQFRPEIGPLPPDEEKRPGGDLSEEEREAMKQRFENMSEQEKEEFKAQMRERTGGRRPQGGDRFRSLSEEERARLKQQRGSMKQRFENMSEQEKEEFRAQMRERSGGRRPQGDAEGGRRRQGAGQQENISE